MSNGTKDSAQDMLQDRLATLVDAYRGLLRADERRLQQAMLEYEQSCWKGKMRHAA